MEKCLKSAKNAVHNKMKKRKEKREIERKEEIFLHVIKITITHSHHIVL